MTAQVSQLRTAKQTTKRVWLSPAQVCEQVPGLTERMLTERRKAGLGPDYHKPTGPDGKVVIYDQRVIDEWVAQSKISTRPA